jgi:signal transduction histidine kinase
MFIFVHYVTDALHTMRSKAHESHSKQELQDLHWKDEAARQISSLRNIIEALPYPFYVIDANDYTVKLANSSARLIGRVFPGSKCHEVSHQRKTPCQGADHPCPLHLVKRTNRSAKTEHRHKDSAGNDYFMEVFAFPVFDDQGVLTEVIEYYVDITDRKRMEEALQESEENERLRISQDLHDHIGQMLVYLKLKLERSMLLTSETDRDKALEEVLDQLIETMKEVRMVSRRLVAGFVKKQTLREALNDLVFSFERTSIIRVKFPTTYIPDDFSPLAQTNIYRIIQEAVSNVAKHSSANKVRISMYLRNKKLHIIIRDNGQGPQTAYLENHTAFRAMKYRVQILDGHIGFHLEQGSHFDIRMVIPVHKLF